MGTGLGGDLPDARLVIASGSTPGACGTPRQIMVTTTSTTDAAAGQQENTQPLGRASTTWSPSGNFSLDSHRVQMPKGIYDDGTSKIGSPCR